MRTTFILLASILALCSVAAAQTRTYTDADEGYARELPSPSWAVVQQPTGLGIHHLGKEVKRGVLSKRKDLRMRRRGRFVPT